MARGVCHDILHEKMGVERAALLNVVSGLFVSWYYSKLAVWFLFKRNLNDAIEVASLVSSDKSFHARIVAGKKRVIKQVSISANSLDSFEFRRLYLVVSCIRRGTRSAR